jgi:hypothetical protein
VGEELVAKRLTSSPNLSGRCCTTCRSDRAARTSTTS